MFCPNCGKQCEDSAQFCANCGASFTQTTAQPEASVVNETPAAPDYGYNPNPGYIPNTGYNPNQPYAPAPEKRNSTAVLVLGIVATVINLGLGCLCGCLGSIPGIVCAIIGLVLGFKNKKTYAPGESDKKNDIGVILCFVSLGILLVVTIINMIIGAAGATAFMDSYY